MDEENLGAAVRAAADGDGGAWEKLVEHFASLVWSVLRAYGLVGADAADVFQTTWLRLVEHLGSVQDPAGVGAWLAMTTRRESLRWLRGGSRVVPTERATWLEALGADVPTPQPLWTERNGELWRALVAITVRCQQVIRVFMASPPPSYAEVAAALDMPVESIGPVRRRCLEQLRRRLK